MIALSILLWTIVLVLLSLLGGWTPGFVLGTIPAEFLLYGWLVIGAGLAVVAAKVRLKKEHTWVSAVRHPGIILIVVAGVIAFWKQTDLNAIGDGLHYQTHRTKYHAIADSVVATIPHRPGLNE